MLRQDEDPLERAIGGAVKRIVGNLRNAKGEAFARPSSSSDRDAVRLGEGRA